MSRPQIHFVTGRLAERALRRTLEQLSPRAGFDYTVDVLPITVAALMTTRWAARHLKVPPQTTKVVLPGYCEGDLEPIQSLLDVPVERGPRDLRQLGRFFGQPDALREQYGAHDIQILAEINHVPRLQRSQVLSVAEQLAAAGADVIDLGCEPGDPWMGVADCVRALRDQGHRVSIDSLNPKEIEPAVRAGAELVLSVNSSNREAAADWGCEVVVIPDQPATLGGLEETLELLAHAAVPLRIDPVLEPIGCGFAASLGRYLDIRRRYPDAEMMMGVGNLTELTDADSAAINVLLLGICQELSVRSVLTTQVINWARSSVRECDLARRLVHFAVHHQVPAKHIEPRLVMLRDTEVQDYGEDELRQLSDEIRDNNYRIFAEQGALHLLCGGLYLAGQDPFVLFDQLLSSGPAHTTPKNLDASHAFYLGYEMAKAVTALTLDKQYRQDEALDWGMLTVQETSHWRQRSSPRNRSRDDAAD